MTGATDEEAKRGFRALVASFVLGVLALGGAGAALAVPERAVPLTLAIASCVAFAALLASIVSFRGGKNGPSIAATLANVFILASIAIAFGGMSFKSFVDEIERQGPSLDDYEDEDFRFVLSAPTFDTFVYDRSAVRSLNERAVAGLWIPSDEVTVLVFVEQLYGRTLDAAAPEEARLALGSSADWEGEPERIRFLGRDAVRIRRSFQRGEQTLYVESTFFVHQELVYHLYTAAELYEPPFDDPWFPGALAAFSLQEGTVHARFSPRSVAADDGPEWRVEDDVYEDLAWGVRVRGEAYELTYGSDAARIDRDAIARIDRRHPDVSLTVRPSRVGGRDAQIAREDLEYEFLGEEPGEPARVVNVAGQDVTFRARSETYDRTWHYLYGVWVDEERAIELIAAAPTAELVLEHLEPLLSHVAIVDPAAMGVAEHAGAWHDVGHRWSARGDLYVDYTDHVSWRRPDPEWRAHPSDVTGEGSHEVVRIESPSRGIRGRITLGEQRHESAAAAHAWVCEAYPDAVEQAQAASSQARGDHELVVSPRLDYDDEYVAAVATIFTEGEAIHVELWATRRDFERHEAVIQEALRGADFWNDPSEQLGPIDSYPRMGFAMRRPWPALETENEWDSIDEDAGALAEYADGLETAGMIAVRRDTRRGVEDQRDAVLDRIYGHVLRSRVNWRERAGRMGGLRCTVRERPVAFGLGATTVYTLEHRGILYVLFVQDRNGIDPDRVARGVRFIE
jgi:hypothetical protein